MCAISNAWLNFVRAIPVQVLTYPWVHAGIAGFVLQETVLEKFPQGSILVPSTNPAFFSEHNVGRLWREHRVDGHYYGPRHGGTRWPMRPVASQNMHVLSMHHIHQEQSSCASGAPFFNFMNERLICRAGKWSHAARSILQSWWLHVSARDDGSQNGRWCPQRQCQTCRWMSKLANCKLNL